MAAGISTRPRRSPMRAHLAAAGAQVIDLGAAASNVDAKPVAPEEEIRRLEPLISALKADGAPVSVDSFVPEVQRFAIARGVDFLNDIQGFPDPSFYPELAAARCRLVVMHAVQGRGRAQRLELAADQVWDRIGAFFASASRRSNEPASPASASSSTPAWDFS